MLHPEKPWPTFEGGYVPFIMASIKIKKIRLYFLHTLFYLHLKGAKTLYSYEKFN